ncbi:MAG: sodium/solute symporter [Fibrobacterales bacterium]
MEALDWVVLFGYLAITALLGFYFSKSNKKFSDFMFGGGSMPWLSVGISLIATSVSATTFLGNPADVYGTNMTYLMCNVGVFLGIAVVGFVFIPKIRQYNASSAYEILEIEFSRPVRLLASTLYSIHLLLRTGLLLYVPSLVLSSILGIHVGWAITLCAILGIVYTYYGGIKAVIWTDVLQFVVLFGGGLLIVYLLADKIGGLSTMLSLASDAGKTKVFDFSLDVQNARTFWNAGIIYLIFEVAIRGCDQQFVQRYLSCKSTKEANYASITSAVLGLAVGVLFFIIGAGLYVFYTKEIGGVLPEGIALNEIFPHYILSELHPGLKGLMVAAIFAAAMSSLDSAITALSNTTVVDFIVAKESDTEGTSFKNAKNWVVVWGIVGIGAAFICAAGEKSILSKALFFTSLFTGPLLGLFIFAFYFKKLQQNAILPGVFLGMASLLLFSKVPWLGILEPVIMSFSWPWNPLISLMFTTLFTVVLNKILNKSFGYAPTR